MGAPEPSSLLFTSAEFGLFFVLLFPLYWLAGRQRRLLLLAASIWFYAQWNSFLALVLVTSTSLDFWLGLKMAACPEGDQRRFYTRLSLAMNLGLLFVFKYTQWFVDSVVAVAAGLFGVQLAAPQLFLPNPVGISFYTFEAISYTVDLFRGRIQVERRLHDLLLFVTFFPHVVAGPIVRPAAFLPQLKRRQAWSCSRLECGVGLFSQGLFKKLALADRLATVVDPVFQTPERFGSGSLGVAVLAYSAQIYCDFSGYSDMAIGLAHLLGFRLAPNFDRPYLSRSVSEFWRRWHISLSSWLRDYLFIPLGGSRGGELRTARNLMITMVLGGLWHGAAWHFVAWGALHGLFLCIHRCWRVVMGGRVPQSWLTHAGSWLLCFTSVNFAWVFFRSPDLHTAGDIISGVLACRSGRDLPVPVPVVSCLFLLLIAGHLPAAFPARSGGSFRGWSPLLRGLGYTLMILAALALRPRQSEPFIYFQF